MGLGSVGATFDRIATPRRILVVGWLWFLVYAFPGYMSYDSVYQLAQARHLEPLTEWHPPVMAIIWRYLDFFVAGPLLMLVLQSVLFLVGLYAILRRVMTDRAAAIVTAVLMIIPQNVIVMAVIWKDSQMAGFLMAAIAAWQSEKRPWRIAGYACLFLATAMRYNSAAATLPIVLLLWDATAKRHWLKRYAMAFGVWVAITAGALLVNGFFVQKKTYPFQTATAPVDVAGTIRFSGRLSDDEILAATKGVPWKQRDKIKVRVGMLYRPMNTFLDVAQEGPYQLFEYPVSDADRAAFANAWKNLVSAHPGAFVRHRIAMFKAQLEVEVGVWAGSSNADWGIDWVNHNAAHSPTQEAWIEEMVELAPTKWFAVIVYFIFAFALLPLCPKNRLAFVILTSGILYELGLFAVAPAIDYRYSHWMVVCTFIGAIVLIASHLRVRKRTAEPLRPALVPETPESN